MTIDEILSSEKPIPLSTVDGAILSIMKARNSKNLSVDELATMAEIDVKELKALENFELDNISLESFARILLVFQIRIVVE